MEKFTIRDWRTDEVIHEGEAESFKEFVEKNKGNLKYADLEDADLEDAYLKGDDLEDAYLKGASLGGANLQSAYLKDAYLKDANLEGANLKGADLEDAYLKGANLNGANLKGTNLEGANLKGAYLKGAYLGGANLNGANFKNSTISINNKRIFAIKLSNSNIEKQDINKIKINIGCKTKTISEWNAWFSSDEEYETKRGTFEFRQIEAMYEAYKAYIVKLWS